MNDVNKRDNFTISLSTFDSFQQFEEILIYHFLLTSLVDGPSSSLVYIWEKRFWKRHFGKRQLRGNEPQPK